MGRYSDLTDEEKRVLRELAEVHNAKQVTTWVSEPTSGGGCLIAADGEESENLTDIPASDTFYIGLAQKGFLALDQGSLGSLHITIQQKGLDCAEYAMKTGFGRWVADVGYDLVQERTVWAKLTWVLLGYALGFLSAVLLRLLGWVKIGG